MELIEDDGAEFVNASERGRRERESERRRGGEEERRTDRARQGGHQVVKPNGPLKRVRKRSFWGILGNLGGHFGSNVREMWASL